MCVCVFGGRGVADSKAHLVVRRGAVGIVVEEGWGPRVQPVAALLPVPASRRELSVCRRLIYARLMSEESNVETVA